MKTYFVYPLTNDAWYEVHALKYSVQDTIGIFQIQGGEIVCTVPADKVIVKKEEE